jgi:hypothetical protein
MKTIKINSIEDFKKKFPITKKKESLVLDKNSFQKILQEAIETDLFKNGAGEVLTINNYYIYCDININSRNEELEENYSKKSRNKRLFLGMD